LHAFHTVIISPPRVPEAQEYIKLSAKDGGRKVLALNVVVIS